MLTNYKKNLDKHYLLFKKELDKQCKNNVKGVNEPISRALYHDLLSKRQRAVFNFFRLKI